MISIDTNLLFYAINQDAPDHVGAYKWLVSIEQSEDIAISEMILAELYGLLRNPKVLLHPMTSGEAAQIIESYRVHPSWRLVGFPSESRSLHNALWQRAKSPEFPFRRLYDTRTALTLLAHGVTEFATANVKDFSGLGFRRVWNPLEGP